MGQARKTREANEARAKRSLCRCGSEDIDCSVNFVELNDEGGIGPRTISFHLCRECGGVLFDWMSEHGFIDEAKFMRLPALLPETKPVVAPKFEFIPRVGAKR